MKHLVLLSLLAAVACAPAAPPLPSSSGEEAPASKQHEQAAPTPWIVYEEFGRIAVKGEIWEDDIVIDSGEVRKRDKGPSRPERPKYNHTPLTPKESIPWECKTLVVGTGMYGRLPVVPEFLEEAEQRGVEVVLLKTKEAVEYFLAHFGPDVNAVFHITC